MALVLFAVFAGNVLLAKAGQLGGFRPLLLPPVWEFVILLAACFVGVLFLLVEERRRGRRNDL